MKPEMKRNGKRVDTCFCTRDCSQPLSDVIMPAEQGVYANLPVHLSTLNEP